MQGKKEEMASNDSSKNPKKANLLDPHSIKHLLDESVTEIVTGRGYVENVTMSNIRLFMGTIIIVIALIAQFYPKKFPENRDFLIGCIVLYIFFSVLLQLIIYAKEKNAIMFTYPLALLFSWIGVLFLVYSKSPNGLCGNLHGFVGYHPLYLLLQGSFNSTGLVISSKLPRFSDMYTISIASADPKSVSSKKPVEFTKSVTQWFTKDGILVEGLFWKDVEGLINGYTSESKKSK